MGMQSPAQTAMESDTDHASSALDTQATARRIRAAIAESGSDATAFSERIGVPYRTLRNYLSGDRAPSPDFLLSAMRTLGLSPAWVLDGAGQMWTTSAPPPPDRPTDRPGLDDDFVVIPMHAIAASAGPGAIGEEPGAYTTAGLCFSRAWISDRRLSVGGLRVISVRGASMEPMLSDGDKVLIDTAETIPRSGYVYVLRQGGELLVKYAQLLPGGVLRVSSANPAFAPYDVDLERYTDVQIIGRVVASMHEW